MRTQSKLSLILGVVAITACAHAWAAQAMAKCLGGDVNSPQCLHVVHDCLTATAKGELSIACGKRCSISKYSQPEAENILRSATRENISGAIESVTTAESVEASLDYVVGGRRVSASITQTTEACTVEAYEVAE